MMRARNAHAQRKWMQEHQSSQRRAANYSMTHLTLRWKVMRAQGQAPRRSNMKIRLISIIDVEVDDQLLVDAAEAAERQLQFDAAAVIKEAELMACEASMEAEDPAEAETLADAGALTEASALAEMGGYSC